MIFPLFVAANAARGAFREAPKMRVSSVESNVRRQIQKRRSKARVNA
jgi:hypothetical protein